MHADVGIVIPAYRPDVDRLAAYVLALEETIEPETIRIELDDPAPQTRTILEALPAEVNVVPERRGKGAAITRGFEALQTDLYAFVDADGSTPPGSLATVLEPVREGEIDLAVGSRRHPEALVGSSQTPLRSLLGDGFAALARTVLPIALYDYQCGAKAITAAGWATVRDEIYEPGFGWDVELVTAAERRELSIAEVPIHWVDRPGSTVAVVPTTIGLLGTLVRTRLRWRRWTTGGLDGQPLAEQVTR